MAANCGRKNVSYSNFETITTVISMAHIGTHGWVFVLEMTIEPYLTPTRPCTKYRPQRTAKNPKINNSIMQLLIALNINSVVANIWLPFLPNDLGHNIFAVTLSTLIEHIVMALIMMPTLKYRGYRTFPGIFSHIYLWKITKCSKQE